MGARRGAWIAKAELLDQQKKQNHLTPGYWLLTTGFRSFALPFAPRLSGSMLKVES